MNYYWSSSLRLIYLQIIEFIGRNFHLEVHISLSSITISKLQPPWGFFKYNLFCYFRFHMIWCVLMDFIWILPQYSNQFKTKENKANNEWSRRKQNSGGIVLEFPLFSRWYSADLQHGDWTFAFSHRTRTSIQGSTLNCWRKTWIPRFFGESNCIRIYLNFDRKTSFHILFTLIFVEKIIIPSFGIIL